MTGDTMASGVDAGRKCLQANLGRGYGAKEPRKKQTLNSLSTGDLKSQSLQNHRVPLALKSKGGASRRVQKGDLSRRGACVLTNELPINTLD